MFKPVVSLRTYSRVSWACLVSLYAIIVSGSLVRLTGSGLGCQDWPRCSDQRFVDVSTSHAAVEQINRLFTGVVAFAVIASVLLSQRLHPRQRSLTWLSFGLVGGVVLQIAIGGIVVVSGLHPAFNMAHYLVSVLLITIAFELHCQVRRRQRVEIGSTDFVPPAVGDPTVSRLTRRLTCSVASLLFVVLIAGTVVTGSGPHAGDESAPRFRLSIQTATRIHSAAVWIALLSVIALFLRIRRSSFEWHLLSRALESLTVAIVAQGFIGYFQYFAGVPAGIVAIHVAISVAVWISMLTVLDSARISGTWRQFVLD
ncbi:MAG: COX15/CtaA family protein [Ilumatobacteraceae bacterium]